MVSIPMERTPFIYQVPATSPATKGREIIERLFLPCPALCSAGIEENDGIFLNLPSLPHGITSSMVIFSFSFYRSHGLPLLPKEEIQLHFVDGIVVISKVIWSIYMGSCLSSHTNTGKIVIIFFNCMCLLLLCLGFSRITGLLSDTSHDKSTNF